MLVMGLGVDHLGWALQVPVFARSFRVISFDNRDVGQSTIADSPYEVADMARDTLALADQLGLEDFHLVGMSLGGEIAQEVALTAPERVRTLTLIVSQAGSGALGRTRARLWSAAASERSWEERVDELLVLTMSERFFDQPERVEWLRNVMLGHPHPQPAEAFARQLQAGARFEARDRLAEVRIPVHVIGGEFDGLLPIWKSREIAELVPGARYDVMEGAPHAVNVERAEELNRLVLDFLAEHQNGR